MFWNRFRRIRCDLPNSRSRFKDKEGISMKKKFKKTGYHEKANTNCFCQYSRKPLPKENGSSVNDFQNKFFDCKAFCLSAETNQINWQGLKALMEASDWTGGSDQNVPTVIELLRATLALLAYGLKPCEMNTEEMHYLFRFCSELAQSQDEHQEAKRMGVFVGDDYMRNELAREAR
jgi:hypothetical protein